MRDIKLGETQRMVQILQKSEDLQTNPENDSHIAKAISLAEDLLDDGVDDLGGQMEFNIHREKTTRGRPKKGCTVSAVRRSKRLKKKNSS